MSHSEDRRFSQLGWSDQEKLCDDWDATPDGAAKIFDAMQPESRWEAVCFAREKAGEYDKEVDRITGKADAATNDAFDEQGPDGPPRLKLVPVSTIQMEQTQWAWRDRIPLGGVTLFAGQEGSGKTTIVTDLLARATRGTLDGDLKGEAVGCVYATAEDSWARTLAPRFAAAGADLERIFHIQIDGLVGGLTVPGDLNPLADAMKATGSRMLVLDPLGAHLGSSLDTHRDAAVRQALAPLASHMDTLGAACVGIVHWSKAPTTQALDRVNGSRAFTAAARAMLAVAEDPDDETSRVLILAKSNLGRLDVPALRYRVEGRTVPIADGSEISTSGIVWLGEAPGIGASDIFSSGDPEERDLLTEACEILTDLLTPNSLGAKDAVRRMTEAGVSKRTLDRAKTKTGVKSRKCGGGGWEWYLPKNANDRQPPMSGDVGDLGDVPRNQELQMDQDRQRSEDRQGRQDCQTSETGDLGAQVESAEPVSTEPQPLTDHQLVNTLVEKLGATTDLSVNVLAFDTPKLNGDLKREADR